MLTETTTPTQNYELEFSGKGSEFFSIMIVNWIFTILTMGLYYPWARAKRMQYVYGNTVLNGERFNFAGTGLEMFRGFIKVVLFYIAIFMVFALLNFTLEMPGFAVLFLYLAIFATVPFALHGSLKYRMSRTSYRSIRFGYRGDRDALVSLFFKGLFFTLITFGIYGAWLSMNIRKYTHENMRYGEASFSNDANGLNWLLLNLKGYFLTIITLGIYFFWWQSDIYSYYFNNLKLTKDEEQIQFRSTTTGGGFFGLLLVNALIVSFTFGLGLPWAEMRLQKYICENVVMEGNLNLDSFTQTEENYKDATGEGAADFFDIELG